MTKSKFLIYLLLLSFGTSFLEINRIEAGIEELDRMVREQIRRARFSISVAFSMRYGKMVKREIPLTTLPSEFQTILKNELLHYEKKLSPVDMITLASTFIRDHYYKYPIEEELGNYINQKEVLSETILSLKYFGYLYLSDVGHLYLSDMDADNAGEKAWHEIGLGFLEEYQIGGENTLLREVIENIVLADGREGTKITGLNSAILIYDSRHSQIFSYNEKQARNRLSELIKVIEAKKTASNLPSRYKEFFASITSIASNDRLPVEKYYVIEFPFDENGPGTKRVYLRKDPMNLAILIQNARLFNLGNLLFYQLKAPKGLIYTASNVITWKVTKESHKDEYLSIADYLKGLKDLNAYRAACPEEIKPSIRNLGKEELEPELENALALGVDPTFNDDISDDDKLNKELDLEQKEFEELDKSLEGEDVEDLKNKLLKEESSSELVENLIKSSHEDSSPKHEETSIDKKESSSQSKQEKQVVELKIVKEANETINSKQMTKTITNNGNNGSVNHISKQGAGFVVGEVGSEILLAIGMGDYSDLRELNFIEISKMWAAMSVGGTSGEGLNYLATKAIPNIPGKNLVGKASSKVLPLYFGILTYDLITTRELKISPMQAVGVANILIGTGGSQALLAMGKAIYYANKGSKLLKMVPPSPTVAGLAKWTIPPIMDFTAIKLVGIAEESLIKQGIEHKLKNRLISAMTNLDILIERIEKDPRSVTLDDLEKARDGVYSGFFEYSLFTQSYIQELIALKLDLDSGKITREEYNDQVKRMDLDDFDISIEKDKSEHTPLREIEMIPREFKTIKSQSGQKYANLLADPFNSLMFSGLSDRDDIKYYEHYNSIYNLISDKPLTLIAQYEDFMNSRMKKLHDALENLSILGNK